MEGSLDGLVVHTSGVHGAEGYTGSPIQIAWLKECPLKKEERPTMIFVHAVNPYGMAHYRRFDQDNVDLNRNALDFDAVKEEMKRNSQLYEPFDQSLFAPRRQPNTFDLYVGIFWNSCEIKFRPTNNFSVFLPWICSPQSCRSNELPLKRSEAGSVDAM